MSEWPSDPLDELLEFQYRFYQISIRLTDKDKKITFSLYFGYP